MYLESTEVLNFRGIRHLKIDFDEDCTSLIGENSWGKTSLLRVLWMILGQGETLCELVKNDLYVPVALFGEAAEQASQPNSIRPMQSNGRPYLDSLLLHRSNAAQIAAQRERLRQLKKMAEEWKSTKDRYYEREYEFRSHDIYREDISRIVIDLIFCESSGSDDQVDTPILKRYWNYHEEDGLYRIHWKVEGYEEDGKFVTRHLLVDKRGALIPSDKASVEKALKMLISLNPVLRIRDRRMPNVIGKEGGGNEEGSDSQQDSFVKLFEDMTSGQALSGEDLKENLATLNTLVEKYFTNYSNSRFFIGQNRSRNVGNIVNRPISLASLHDIESSLDNSQIDKSRFLIGILVGAVRASQGDRSLNRKAKPIFIFEDIDSRFHPSLLLSFWSLVSTIGCQKIITTNSGDLLSAMPVSSLRRLYRIMYDTRVYKVNPRSFSDDDMRRIAFHVRINRPMSLFARCWLLVEGETEIWILSEIASILGISLQCSGIRPIEFAQCGLQPLIRFARQLGIGFYVLTDGDEAGQKYANVVRNYVDSSMLSRHLTVLPHIDIEHFLYNNGYKDVYRKATGIVEPIRKGTSVDKIIEIAIRKKSKPGLAIEVLNSMRQAGVEGVPPLFVKMIKNLTSLAREGEAIV